MAPRRDGAVRCHAVSCSVESTQGNEPERYTDGRVSPHAADRGKAEPATKVLPEPVGRAALFPRRLHPRTDAERHLPPAAQRGT